jgi:hypothetical protein
MHPTKLLLLLAAAGWLGGCASSSDKSPTKTADPAPAPTEANAGTKFKTTDGRTITIGKPSASNGGTSYKDPHLEKCWVADGFNFTGLDTIYVAPTLSTAKFNEKNKEEVMVHDRAKDGLVYEIARTLSRHTLATNVVTKESDFKPGARVLKLENTITEFTKGGGGARYFVGLYGGGQPVLRVQGKLTEGDKTLFSFEARRSGTSAGSRMGGAFMKDEDIQSEDIRSLVLDLTDFMAALAGKYTPKP